MPFRNPLITFLKIYQSASNRIAIWIKSGANAFGVGEAVVQFYTGDVSEVAPAEITADATTLTPFGGNPRPTELSLQMSSPTQGTATDPSVRSILGLYARDTLLGTSTYAKFECGSVTVKPPRDSATDSSAVTLSVGQVGGASDSAVDTALRLIGNVRFLENPPELFNNETDISGILQATVSARAGNFRCTVEKIGNNHAFIEIHFTVGGAALASGALLIAAGALPAWATPAAGNTQHVPAVQAGNVTAGQHGFAQITSTGAINIFSFAPAAGANCSIIGMYKTAPSW